jgi:hypothetical protein
MKKLLLPLLVLQLAFCGCTHSYVMKLTNGTRITTASKPKLQGAVYVWKDARGKENRISQSRVVEVLPASMAKEEKEIFKPTLK